MAQGDSRAAGGGSGAVAWRWGRAAVVAGGLLVGCGGGEAPADKTGAAADTGPDSATPEPDGDTGRADGLAPGEGAFGGTVVDDEGAPLEGILVNLCAESCYAQRTDAAGAWQHQLPADRYSLELLEGDPSAPTRGWPLAPVVVEAGVVRTLETPVRMPLLTHHEELRTAGWVKVGDGLDLHADPATWTPPELADPEARPWVAGVRVDVATAGLPWDGIAGTPVALWYLNPLDSRPTGDWPVRLSGDVGLAAGETARLFAADYGAREWVPFATVTVDDEGALRTTNDPLPVLGPVVLVRE